MNYVLYIIIKFDYSATLFSAFTRGNVQKISNDPEILPVHFR